MILNEMLASHKGKEVLMEEMKVLYTKPNAGCLHIVPRESGPDVVQNGPQVSHEILML